MPNPIVTLWPEGKMPPVLAPGDFLLTSNPAGWFSRNGFVDRMISTGESLSLLHAGVPRDQRKWLSRWTHAVAVGDGTLIEAVGKGVVRSPLDKYEGKDFLYVHTDLTDDQRAEAVAIWDSFVGFKYGFLTDACIGFTALTGSSLRVKLAHTMICSGLVCAGLGIHQYADDPSFVRPDQLAAYHGIDGNAVITPAAA
jgi:hypothetical protein